MTFRDVVTLVAYGRTILQLLFDDSQLWVGPGSILGTGE